MRLKFARKQSSSRPSNSTPPGMALAWWMSGRRFINSWRHAFSKPGEVAAKKRCGRAMTCRLMRLTRADVPGILLLKFFVLRIGLMCRYEIHRFPYEYSQIRNCGIGGCRKNVGITKRFLIATTQPHSIRGCNSYCCTEMCPHGAL